MEAEEEKGEEDISFQGNPVDNSNRDDAKAPEGDKGRGGSGRGGRGDKEVRGEEVEEEKVVVEGEDNDERGKDRGVEGG